MLMNLLLKQDGYPPAVLFALLLHAGLIWFMLDRAMSPSDMVKIQPATIAVATAKENPQRLRRIEQVQQQQRVADQRTRDEARAREQAAREREATQRAEAERQRQAETQRQAERQRQEQARIAEEDRQATARRQAEQEQQRQAELQRQREAQARAEAERQAQIQAQANAQSQGAENDLVSQYMGIIRGLIQQNWVIPPSARNGMAAIVEIRTTPVGDITSYLVIQSSGDATFDRSVLQAVARVGNLQELRDVPSAVYERNFRRFNLLFQPEDLLR
jgi:colicin import membrane protein